MGIRGRNSPGVCALATGTSGNSITIRTETATSVNELIGTQVCASPGASFSGINKCIARFVVSCDALFTGSGGFDGEWYMGIANPDGAGNVYAGAMLS